MGYYMRFFDTSEQTLNLPTIEIALRAIDPAYRIQIIDDSDALQGELHFDDGLYGEIEINQVGDGLFDEEVQEQLESLDGGEQGDSEVVAATLRSARRSVVVRVLSQGRECDDTLERIDPLWRWLFSARQGLLQADGEGYWDSQGLIFEVD